jgi:hypothetical protein
VHGQGAIVELLERMPAEDRPDVFAIYDSWWPGLVPDFGVHLFDVVIDDNVICADKTKRVYRADWSLLEPRTGDWVDRLDVGDLVDERDHAFTMPHPRAGYVTTSILRDASGARRFDAGRIVPRGREITFAVRGDFARGDHVLRIRSDEASPREIWIERAGHAPSVVHSQPAEPGAWSETPALLDGVGPGDVVRVRAVDGALRIFAFAME